MKERFEGSVAEKSTLEQAIRTEELERGKKEAAIVAREKSSEFRNVAVLNQHAAMKLQFKSHADEMVSFSIFYLTEQLAYQGQ